MNKITLLLLLFLLPFSVAAKTRIAQLEIKAPFVDTEYVAEHGRDIELFVTTKSNTKLKFTMKFSGNGSLKQLEIDDIDKDYFLNKKDKEFSRKLSLPTHDKNIDIEFTMKYKFNEKALSKNGYPYSLRQLSMDPTMEMPAGNHEFIVKTKKGHDLIFRMLFK
ncbi:MAG: hypothetical protein HQL32_15390 [Planctomycetes bacterium]|nr:hypothetical protein [Planctomycetota bacterium]